MNEIDWQPIETAPKDGQNILVYDPTLFPETIEVSPGRYTFGEFKICRGVYISFWREADNLNRAAWMDGCVFGSPTYWMPLPKPPNERNES